LGAWLRQADPTQRGEESSPEPSVSLSQLDGPLADFRNETLGDELAAAPADQGPVPPPVDRTDADAERPASLGGRVASVRTVLSFVLGFGIIALFLSRQDPQTLRSSWTLVRRASPELYLLALATYYTAFGIRAARWRILLANSGEPPERIPGVGDLAEIIYLSWFANSVVPAKLGDVYRGWLLRRTGGASLSHGMGTIVAERVLDAVVLVTLMLVAGVVTYGDVLAGAVQGGTLACVRQGLRGGSTSCVLVDLLMVGGVVAAGLLLALVAFARYGARLGSAIPRIPTRALGIYNRFSDALVLSFGRFGPLLTLSALAWAAEGTAFWLVGHALGYSLPLPLVVFFSLLQAFITVIPLTPGGLGFEVFLAAALSLRGLDQASALAMTALYRTITYASLIAGGSVVYVFSRKTK
jgi:uncharacterized membrane protein YbhN (UPF0104 family)